MEQETQKHITLSSLANRVGGALAEALPAEFWVVGEISECKLGAGGHLYMTLVERDEAGRAPRAEFKANIWASRYRMIDSYFRSATGTALGAGMKVLLLVSINYHPNYGLSLVVSDIDATYTVGESELQRRQTIERLEKEGLFDMQREFALPIVAQRFAIISSATAAGYEDFAKQLADAPYRIEITLFTALMQGEQTERSVCAALGQIEARSREFDAVVIIRGGGSASDLRWFDSYEISAAVARFPMPILTGIGHEKDVSVVDMVAFHSFKTPTAVAAGLIDRIAAIEARLAKHAATVVGIAQNMLLAENARIERAASVLHRLTGEALRTNALKIERLSAALVSGAMSCTAGQSARLDRLHTSLRSLAFAVVEKSRSKLELLTERIAGQDPRRILKMGYSIVKAPDGTSLKSIKQAPAGTLLDIELTDGTIKTQVK